MTKKVINTSGKRKRAIARATLRQGKGKIRINKVPLDFYEPKMQPSQPLYKAYRNLSYFLFN